MDEINVDITRLVQLRGIHSGFDFFVEKKRLDRPVQQAHQVLPPKPDIRYLEADMDKIVMNWTETRNHRELRVNFHLKPGREVNWFLDGDLTKIHPDRDNDFHYWVRELMPDDVQREFVWGCNIFFHDSRSRSGGW
jgi:hypothetical protein